MLATMNKSGGMTLVEVMVAVTILIFLFAAAAPSFTEWIANSRIRSSAESVINGLTLARTEAVHRNLPSQFVSCGGDSSWDVIVASAAVSAVVCGTANAAGWATVQQYRSSGTDRVSSTNTQSTIGFNGLGRQSSTFDHVNGVTTANPPVAVTFNLISATSGVACTCAAGTCGYPVTVPYSSTGTARCLRIEISNGGQVRMCDPALPSGTPRGC